MPASPKGSWGDKALGGLQSMGRALMLPIAVLPAAALLLRLGQPDIFNWTWMAAAGDAVFSNLSLIFALGIALGMAGGEGAAALAGVVGFLVFTAVFNTIIPQVAGKPDPSISMGVLSGILMGLTAAGLYRRFHDIRLPNYLAFFGGRRFVPIITAVAAVILGVIFGLIWPPINVGVNTVGSAIVSLGPLGTGIYGFLNRLLIPLGLHHVLNSYVWFELGSYHGKTGDLNRYFAGDPSAGNFMAGFFPMMMFGLPAACFAMIRHAKFPKVAAGILLSAAFASFLTGVTEPIEFAFIFVAPVLFLIHAVLTGTALAVCTLLNVKIGFGFSAGFIDYVLNFNKANTTNPLLIIVIGLVYAVLYYFIFSFCITRFNLATPGRDASVAEQVVDGMAMEQEHEVSSADVKSEDPDTVLAYNVLAALGGNSNVESVEGCITRLRLTVGNADKIDESRLKSLGASGVIKRGKIAQVVMGTQSDRIALRMNRILKDELVK
ncbi:PTS transporter subunit EIIC [Tengunoibacter tsumagoiensis]